jgi:hypothetical protein
MSSSQTSKENTHVQRSLSTKSKYTIRRKVSNVLDEHDAMEQFNAILKERKVAMEAQQSRCKSRVERGFLWFAYCFQERWARGVCTQCRLLAQGFFIFWIFCTVVLIIGRSTDSEMGYPLAEPFCGNASTCTSINLGNTGLDLSTATGVFLTSFWDSWTYMGDPGTHAGEETWPRRIAAFTVTMLGIFMMATVIGFISNIMIEMMEDLRTGKSAVIEEGHTLLLGWTSSTVSLITELIIANESEGGGVIVVLANTEVGTDQKKKKEEIENVIKHSIDELGGNKGTKVVIRIGDYTLMAELAKVGVDKARAIVVQAPAGNADKADSSTLRAVLSLRALQIKMGDFRGSIIAELRDIDNQLLIQTVGGKDVLTVVSHDIIGRIMIKSARNPGLADVYEGLLGFEGAEFYMKCHDEDCPEIAGMHFGDLFDCYDGAIPFGVHRFHREHNADHHRAQDQVVSQMLHQDGMEIASTKPELDYFLNPPSSLIIKKGDEIVVLAEDDDTYSLDIEKVKKKKLERMNSNNKDEIPDFIEQDNVKKEIILMVGWRRDVDDIIRLLNTLTGKGSELHIFSNLSLDERLEKLAAGGLDLEEEDVAWKDDTHDSVEWGDHHHDNFVLLLEGEPNLRIVQWQGQPANMRDIKILNRKLAEFWEEDDDVFLTSSERSPLRIDRDSNFDTSAFEDKPKKNPIRRMSSRLSKNKSFNNKHALKQFDSILILADERLEMDAMHSDSNVLASLLLLKDEQLKQGVFSKNSLFAQEELQNQNQKGKNGCTITFEIVDPRTQQILKTNAAITEGSFYIISTHIVAKYLAMVAERKEIHGVLRELLGPAGAEISLINIDKFVSGHRSLTFRELQAKCRKKEAICLGYVQRKIDKNTGGFEVYRSGLDDDVLNTTTEPLPRNLNEKIITMGEDENFKIVTELIIIKGRHHDLATLEHFGMGQAIEEFKKQGIDFLTTDHSLERLHSQHRETKTGSHGGSEKVKRVQSKGVL